MPRDIGPTAKVEWPQDKARPCLARYALVVNMKKGQGAAADQEMEREQRHEAGPQPDGRGDEEFRGEPAEGSGTEHYLDLPVRAGAIDWKGEFKAILDDGGFHAVVGNPPYVLVQTLNNQEVFRYLSNHYKAAKYKICAARVMLILCGALLRQMNGRLDESQ